MHRHAFSQLTAHVKSGGVQLGFYFTAPVFSSLKGSRLPAIRIHRKCEPRFTWGQDYAEYFGGMDAGKARVIFEESIEPINGRKFEFIDEKVEVGRTYVYWVSCPLGRLPTGPVAVHVRDHRIWWPHEKVASRLAAMAQAHPTLAALTQYGTTIHGHALPGLLAGNRDRCIALVGTIHAGESGPELMIPAVERLLAENAALLARAGIAILPNVNVDERERLVRGCPWYLRTNARGVDINRNFDADWEQVDTNYGFISSDPDALTYRGPQPESEPETRAVLSFLQAVAPRAVLSYHWLTSITGAKFLAPCAAADDTDYVNACRRLVEPFITAFYPEERWKAGLRFGTTAGSLPTHVYRSLRVPGFDLEGDDSPETESARIGKTTPEILKAFQERHYQGLVALLKTCAEN